MGKKDDIQTREVGMLSLRAEFQPASVDAEKRTVDLVWTTGAPVLRRDYDGSYYEELSLDPKHVRMGRLNNGAPFLANHDGYDVRSTLGVVQPGSAKLSAKEGTATVRFAKAEDDPEADKVFRKIKDGILTNVSVGYRVHKMDKVEGKDKVPTYRAIDWEPHEISAVAMGADQAAGFRSLFIGNSEELENMEPKNAGTEAPATDTEATRAAELKTTAENAAKAERTRAAGITAAARAMQADQAQVDKWISEGTPLETVRAHALETLAKRSDADEIDGHQPSVKVGEEDGEKWLRGVTNALLARTGQLPKVAAVLEDQKNRPSRHQNLDLITAFKGFDAHDNGGEFRGFSLVDLARESLERKGVRTRGLSTEKIVERAFYARDNGGQQTASDFSVALENVMYKTLLGSYAQQSDTWRRFCGTDSVQDFRNSNRYRLGSFGVLDSLDESGEYKAKTIPDAVKQTISTTTYGNKIALSRKAIINDDMGAVVASADRFGRMAGLSIEVAVYALLAQNGGLGPSVTYNGTTAPLFDAGFANISTGAAITADALVADQVKMASQKDISNNEYLDLRPNVLLVPLSLEATAKQINRAAYDPTAGAAFEAPNKAAGLFRDIVGTPRLSGTRRYVFTDQTPSLLVVFLNGVQVPVMDQRPGWDIDGVEWKLRLDFNAQGFDPKGAITNAGS